MKYVIGVEGALESRSRIDCVELAGSVPRSLLRGASIQVFGRDFLVRIRKMAIQPGLSIRVSVMRARMTW
jgi:hypothetical protein